MNLSSLIQGLGVDAGYKIINETRMPADYLLNRILPEMPKADFNIDMRYMTIRPTMAGLVGMDQPYPPIAKTTGETFNSRTAKVASKVHMPEETLRELRAFLTANGNSSRQGKAELVSFLQGTTVQAHWDTMEFLRGQALTGQISWQFNGIHLDVNYGIPANNVLPPRTLASTTAYGQPGSVLWEDIHALQNVLNYNVRFFLVHPQTYTEMVSNSANSLQVTGGSFELGYFDVVRLKATGTGSNINVESSDARDRVRFFVYGNEGEIVDPNDPTSTITMPFIKPGKIIAIGNAGRSGYTVGRGSVVGVQDDLAVGYTHIAPTVEGDFRLGRWARIYTPQERQWEVLAEGVTNGLPVVEAPTKIAIAETELLP